MKKSVFIFIALFASVCSHALAEDQDMQQPDAQAQDTQRSDWQRPGMQQGGDRGDRQGMMGQNKMGMMGGNKMEMMGMGMHPTVVATNDGGVVVLMGNKLSKYDNNLNLLNDVELKGGPKSMDKKMDDTETMKRPILPRYEPTGQAASTDTPATPADSDAPPQ